MLSRRSFIQVFLASLSALPFLDRVAMAQFLFVRPKKKLPPRTRENPFTEGGKALVGVYGKKGATAEELVKEAVSLIGGFEKLGVKGKTVLVKPNVVNGEPNPTTTSPEVAGAAVKLLYEKGAKKVYVGDMSALQTLSTTRNMKNTGIWQEATKNGAEPITFEDHGWIEVPLPETDHVKKAYVTEWVYNVDLIVNLPVVKTHRSATYSITLKNFIGCTHLKQRPYFIDSSHWEEIVAEFNAAYTPDINIVDGTVSMVAGGPWRGTEMETNLIIASGDRVAADIVGLGIIKSFGLWNMVYEKDVWEQRQIATALKLGVGRDRDNIKLLAEGDKDLLSLMEKVRKHTGLSGGTFL